MDIFSVFSLLGGLALFLYGMNILGDGLEKLSGGKLEKTLEKMTSNTMKGFLLGAAVTAIIQSSSATTVMVVGFVNSGIMKLKQAIGIIMGANVGTTITAWILSLSGIQGDSLIMQLLKPANFSPLFAFAGIILIMFSKSDKKHNIGGIFIGFAVLMFGMESMSSAVAPLADVPEFTHFLTMFENPLFGVLAGALLTAVIQSSSASVGILQALSSTGSITYSMAIPIVMGQNIGTCVTALISCIGAKKNAKRAAIVHLYFNIIGTLVWLTVFYSLNAFMQFSFVSEVVGPAEIAIIHTIFNLLSTSLLLPFARQLEKLACLTIRDKQTDEETVFIDERFLNTPAIATEQCTVMAGKMADRAYRTIMDALSLLKKYDEKKAEQIQESEEKIDQYEDVLGTYLVKLSSRNLTVSDSKEVARLLHCIGDFERIGDHAINILNSAKEMHDKKIGFSDKAKEELQVIIGALDEVLETTVVAFQSNDVSLAETVEPLEQVIDRLSDKLKSRHIKRLQDGECTIEMGFVLSDLLTNCERVSDHCSNVAVCIIQINLESFETHEYLQEIKSEDDGKFKERYENYLEKYPLPKNV
ncbi:MAG: Na/Pi cotransporter family protein [Ruminococcus sp.]|nr:Na/Pi cotransporter family protein [Ruminococcus sp.]